MLSTAFAQWELDGHGDYKDLLTKRAFEMVVSRDPLLTATGIPSTPDFIQPLLGRKLLIQRDNDFYFRHNLIRDYLASLWLQDQWRDILSDQSISIDQNWTEMLKFVANFTFKRFIEDTPERDVVPLIVRKRLDESVLESVPLAADVAQQFDAATCRRISFEDRSRFPVLSLKDFENRIQALSFVLRAHCEILQRI